VSVAGLRRPAVGSSSGQQRQRRLHLAFLILHIVSITFRVADGGPVFFRRRRKIALIFSPAGKIP
ncbi:hypothetical protein, partial [Serratia rubidaea]|uniref:hypothetical protein n=1 Tax=Serratia rubidaea TaxID=61652 RepID=UPI001F388278